MCYILAKAFDEEGCVALKADRGPELAKLRRELDESSSGKGIQIVTISRPSAYGEYSPYRFVETKDELRHTVANMTSK